MWGLLYFKQKLLMQKVEVLLSAQVEDVQKAQALCGRVMRYAKKLGLKVEKLENKFYLDEQKLASAKFGDKFPEGEMQGNNQAEPADSEGRVV